KENLFKQTSEDFKAVTLASYRWTSPILTLDELGLRAGDVVTLSADIQTNASNDRVSLRLDFIRADQTYHQKYGEYITFNGRYSVTGEIPSDAVSLRWRIYPRESYSGYTAYYAREKLEKGSVTSFTHTPYDIQPDTPDPTIYKTNISLPEPLRSVGD